MSLPSKGLEEHICPFPAKDWKDVCPFPAKDWKDVYGKWWTFDFQMLVSVTGSVLLIFELLVSFNNVSLLW